MGFGEVEPEVVLGEHRSSRSKRWVFEFSKISGGEVEGLVYGQCVVWFEFGVDGVVLECLLFDTGESDFVGKWTSGGVEDIFTFESRDATWNRVDCESVGLQELGTIEEAEANDVIAGGATEVSPSPGLRGVIGNGIEVGFFLRGNGANNHVVS